MLIYCCFFLGLDLQIPGKNTLVKLDRYQSDLPYLLVKEVVLVLDLALAGLLAEVLRLLAEKASSPEPGRLAEVGRLAVGLERS